MLKRIYEFLSVVLILAGLGGVAISFRFLFLQAFIEASAAGLLSFILLRTAVLIVRLTLARNSLEESHSRVLRHLEERGKK